jgi:hypothetical protein
LGLNRESLDVELREPFNMIANVHDQHIWRHSLGTLRTFRWSTFMQLFGSLRVKVS